MTIIDPIGDMFTRIRNGQMRNLNSVNIPASKFRSKILEILQSEGYINSFFLDNNEKNKKVIKLILNITKVILLSKKLKEYLNLEEEYILERLVYQKFKMDLVWQLYLLLKELCQIYRLEKII